jgi:hypothetical protein
MICLQLVVVSSMDLTQPRLAIILLPEDPLIGYFRNSLSSLPECILPLSLYAAFDSTLDLEIKILYSSTLT